MITSGKKLSVSNSLTLAGTDSTTLTFPGTSQTIPGMNQANTAGSSFTLDASAASVTAGLKVPSAAGAVPTADGFVATNTSNHTYVWGSNGTTMVGAIAATGTGTATTCTNQFVSAISSLAMPTCTTITLAGAQFANQGTTTTVLHGNASGNPSFGAIVNADITNSTIDLTTKVTGLLPVGNGGLGIGSGTSGGIPYFSGTSTIASSAALASGRVVLGGGAGVAPKTDAGLTTAGTGATMQLSIGSSILYALDVDHTVNTVGIRSGSSTAGNILYYANGTVTGSIDVFNSAVNARGTVGAVFGNAITPLPRPMPELPFKAPTQSQERLFDE